MLMLFRQFCLPGFVDAVEDAVEGQEEDHAAADPVQAGNPHFGSVGAAEDAMQQGEGKDEVAGKVDRAPGFATDLITDVIAENDQTPDVEAQLSQTDPLGQVIGGGEGGEHLGEGEVDVLVADQEQAVDQAKAQTEQAGVLVQGGGGGSAGPNACHLVGDHDAHRHGQPQQPIADESGGAGKVPVEFGICPKQGCGDVGHPRGQDDDGGCQTDENGQRGNPGCVRCGNRAGVLPGCRGSAGCHTSNSKGIVKNQGW